MFSFYLERHVSNLFKAIQRKILNFEKESSDKYTEAKRHVSLSMGHYWALALKKGALGPLIFRLQTHEIHHQLRNLITILHAHFEFSTLRTVGGVGF